MADRMEDTNARRIARNRTHKPWKEYFPWQPDDMPPKGGNPAALAKLLAAELDAYMGEYKPGEIANND